MLVIWMETTQKGTLDRPVAQTRGLRPEKLDLPHSCSLLQQRECILRRHYRRVSVVVGQNHLYEEVDRSPDRVQQAREREIEEPQHEVLRSGRSHDSLDALVPALDLPAIAIFADSTCWGIRQEHCVLSVVGPLRVLFALVDERGFVLLVFPEVKLSVSSVVILTSLEQSFYLCLFAGIHPLGHDVRQSSLRD